MEIGFYFSVILEKSGHVDNEVPDYWKAGKGLDENGISQQRPDLGPAGQDQFSVDLHRTRAADCAPARITKRKGWVLLILNPEQGLQKVHARSRLNLEGVHPGRRIFFRMITLNS
jgi:hypothetical protein